jgi:hypothetical protein
MAKADRAAVIMEFDELRLARDFTEREKFSGHD